MEMFRQTVRLIIGTAFLWAFGSAQVSAQSQIDAMALLEANNGYYAALSALDMEAMEKVWLHESYVSQVGPRNAAPLTGWATIQPYLVKTWANFSELKVRPVDPHARVNGDVGWVIGQEEVGNTSRLKTGTLLSSRPTIVTNIFEKHDGKWLMVSHHAQEPSQ
jgi:ketosteroid isomerase-like protein